MGVTEDIFIRCQQLLEESAVLLESGKKITTEEIHVRRRAANIAGEAAFILLQKAFITPFDREDIWDFRQACESVWEAAQELALAGKPFLQGAIACRKLSVAAEQLPRTSNTLASSLFSAELHFRIIPPCELHQNFIQCGKQAVFCLQRLLLKSS